MISFFKTPYLARWVYPSLTWNIESTNSMYLTFDDGPDEEVTPWVLDRLHEVDAKATFFCIGNNLDENRDLAKNMIDAGHLISNHTFDHLNGRKVSNQQYWNSVEKCDHCMDSLGISNAFFRPPYGNIKRSQLKMLHMKKIIMWSHLAYDFDANLDVKASLKALRKAPAGSIVAFHDSKKAYNNLKLILPELLTHFQERGLTMETLNND